MTDTPRLFDADAFAAQLRRRIAQLDTSDRQVALATGVSTASLSRMLRGWSDASHENVLRLQLWLASTASLVKRPRAA